MSKVMLVLAREWQIGYAVSISICVITYLLYSILLVVSCRKKGMDVGVSAMIPIVNLIVLVQRGVLIHRKKRIAAMNEEIEL